MQVFLGSVIGLLGVVLIVAGFQSRGNELYWALFGSASPLQTGAVGRINPSGTGGSSGTKSPA